MKILLCALLALSALPLRGDELWDKMVANVAAARSWRPSKVVIRTEMVGVDGTGGHQERTYYVQMHHGTAAAVQIAHSENGVKKGIDETTPIPLDELMPHEPFFDPKMQDEVTVRRQTVAKDENIDTASYGFSYRGAKGTVIVETGHALPLKVSCTAPEQPVKTFSSKLAVIELRYVIERDGVWHPTVITTRSSENYSKHPRTLILSVRFENSHE